jgi:hypothetical protein
LAVPRRRERHDQHGHPTPPTQPKHRGDEQQAKQPEGIFKDEWNHYAEIKSQTPNLKRLGNLK